MGSNSKIEWTEATWNPVTGCTKCSPGCLNCYAEKMTKRLQAMGLPKYASGFDKVMCHPEALEEPLKRKKPTTYFVNSMSDTFHEDVPFEFVEHMWDTVFDCSQHTFIVLTKRIDRAQQYQQWLDGNRFRRFDYPNLWLGVTVCNQQEADEKIPLLLDTPAAVRFVSIEPMLEAIDLTATSAGDILCRCGGCMDMTPDTRLDWVICGGESGPGARPMHPDWPRKLRDDCVAAGVPFFFKQWGEWVPNDQLGFPFGQQDCITPEGTLCGYGRIVTPPGCATISKVGKKAAGRLLDGVKWEQIPERSE